MRVERGILKLLKGVGVVLLFVSCVLARASAGQASPGAELKKDLRLIFVGDIMTHKEQLESARGSDGEWNFTPQFRRVKPLFRFAGQNRSGGVLVTGNLETVFAGEKRGFAGYPSFNTPDALADALADLGMNVLTLANNHILDRGFSGAKRTTEVLDGTGLLWTGLEQKPGVSFDVLTAEEAGLKIAFVNYSYGSNRMLTSSTGSPDISLNTISDAAVTEGLARALLSSPDFVAACFHWGNEYQTAPTKRQKALAALSIEHGADLVIGTHPHVLQPVEILSSDRSGSGRNDRPAARHFVAYSLGNFVSYQRTPPRERSVVLAVDIEKTSEDIRARVLRVSVAPVWVSARRTKGRRLVEVVYAGESARFNHAGLPSKELAAARTAGKSVLEFLGAVGSADEEGFYTLWDAVSPDVLPVSRRKSPL